MIITNQNQRYAGPMSDGLRELVSDAISNGSSVVEVGSYLGDSTLLLLESGKISEMYCVDPFIDELATAELKHFGGKGWGMSDVKETFESRVTNVYPQVKLLQMTSTKAAEHLAGRSFDLIYIDGNHSYESVKEDILTWLPLVKRGGYITGHDFMPNWPGVEKAVREILGPPDKTYKDTSWLKKII